jgi:hypothetical protein
MIITGMLISGEIGCVDLEVKYWNNSVSGHRLKTHKSIVIWLLKVILKFPLFSSILATKINNSASALIYLSCPQALVARNYHPLFNLLLCVKELETEVRPILQNRYKTGQDHRRSWHGITTPFLDRHWLHR